MSVGFALRTRLLLGAAFLACFCPGYLLVVRVAAQEIPAQQNLASAQSPQKPESGGLVIRENVRRVIVDVVVTDANDKPVLGLSRDDFSVAEDGEPQRVLSFDLHDFKAAPATYPDPLTPLPLNTFMNVPHEPERGPLYLILYDMVNMSMDDQGTARKQLLRFISAKPPGVRFAIFVLSDGLRLVQGFTDDPYVLFAAMDPKTPRPHVPKVFLYGENYGQGAISHIRWTFTQIAKFLDGFPGRKNVLWVTGSLSSSILPVADRSTDAVSYNDEIKEAINEMARSQVAVYPIDVRGVVTTNVIANPGGVAMSDSSALYASYSTEDDLAIATGGRAFYSTNGLGEALADATISGGNYYTLTYAPSNQRYDGQLRKIHVELSKRGYHLAYRQFYFGGNPDPASRQKKGAKLDAAQEEEGMSVDSLFTNMEHGAPMAHQIVFKAHVYALGRPAKATPEQMLNLAAPASSPGGKSRQKSSVVRLQAYAIDYAVPAQQLKEGAPAIGRPRLLLELAAAAFDGDGQLLMTKVQHSRDTIATSPWNVGEGAAAPSEFYRAQQQIAVPLNATSIRLGVKDVSTGRVGAFEVTLPLTPEPQTQAASPGISGQPVAPAARFR